MNKISFKGISDDPSILLPNINRIINQLKSRIYRLKEDLANTIEVDEEIIYEDELYKTNLVLNDLQKSKEQFSENDLSIISTHSSLELEYFKSKRSIEEKMNSSQKITEEDLTKYNLAIHKYNLFCSVVESVY